MNTVRISFGKINFEVELLNTPSAKEILKNLPFASKAQVLEGEVYFETPIQIAREDNAKEVIEAGEIAFWCEGSCIALAYAPTPSSAADEIRLTAACNIWAKAVSNVADLKNVRAGDMVFIEAAPEA